VIGAMAAAVFIALTILVTTNPSPGIDHTAFKVANDLRAPWLDHAARIITTLGLIAVVGSAVALAGLLLIRRKHAARGTALVAGAALAWASTWITKRLVDRPRPPAPLVHTSGQSYPSAHAANSVGWLALAIALTIVIPNRNARIAAVIAGALLTILVGLSRVYLRAHYLTDVLGGESLAVTMYALTAIATLAWVARRKPDAQRPSSPSTRSPA
jgi:undecaprenyl-diphosphatase